MKNSCLSCCKERTQRYKLPTSPRSCSPQKPSPSRKGNPRNPLHQEKETPPHPSITRMAPQEVMSEVVPREVMSEVDLAIVGKMDTESRKVMALVSRSWRLAVRLVTLQERVSEQTRKRDRLKKLLSILEKEENADKRASRTVDCSIYRCAVKRLFNFRTRKSQQAYENLSSLASGLELQDRMPGILSPGISGGCR